MDVSTPRVNREKKGGLQRELGGGEYLLEVWWHACGARVRVRAHVTCCVCHITQDDAALTMARERVRVSECGCASRADDARNNRFVPTLRLALRETSRVAKFGTVINGRIGPRAPLVSADLEPR